jgi:hypothetical protein
VLAGARGFAVTSCSGSVFNLPMMLPASIVGQFGRSSASCTTRFATAAALHRRQHRAALRVARERNRADAVRHDDESVRAGGIASAVAASAVVSAFISAPACARRSTHRE